MEENQNDLQNKLPAQDPVDEREHSIVQGLPQEQIPAEQEFDGEELDFGFVEKGVPENKKKKTGKGAFYAIFGSLLVICLALLVLVMFLGENGIRIYRTVQSERVVYVREDNGTSGLLTPQEAANAVRKSTVTVSSEMANGTGTGSGFVYDENGHVCTNYHVIKGAVRVQVVLPDGHAYDAEVVGYNEPADLAVLRVQASGLVPVALGSSANLLVGDEVVAVGTPASVLLAGTATFGRVSCTERLLPLDDDGDGTYECKIKVIQTDAGLNPGNSGGPVADMYGRVVGIVVRKILNYNGKTYEGVGFAIPIDGAKTILDAIIRDGSFTGENPVCEGRSVLGVTGHLAVKGKWYYADLVSGQIASSDQELPGYYCAPADGVYVIEVQGENAKGRLLKDDMILAVNGLAVRDVGELITAVNRYPCGVSVAVRVLRGGAELTVDVVLAEG